jgi:UDP-N-acetylmuramoyl-L-alanyl-D-glutamate--2,6-diaminopimelate ligase
MIGLTGTNGKTTTSYIIKSIINASGAVSGLIGTIIYDDCSKVEYADRTTPEGPDVQDILSRAAANGARYCVMEVSSHGLDQGRVEGCGFVRAGFSNLTPEHLEYHENMERYFEAKKKLFTDYMEDGWAAAVNADDQYGRRLIDEFPGAAGFSLLKDAGSPRAAYTASLKNMDINGMTLDVTCPGGSYSVTSPLVGSHNAANILESVAIGESLGFDAETIQAGVIGCPQIPGRLERYAFSNGVAAFVDYAHSEDGMRQALGALSRFAVGGVRVLWGAGGERTPLKRPAVGEIMATLARHVIITTDNPRSEDPADIARDVERGVKNSGKSVRCDIVLDRKEAITFALDSSRPGDIVLIAGKGPERFIDYGAHKTPFVDSDAVLEWAAERSLEVLGT